MVSHLSVSFYFVLEGRHLRAMNCSFRSTRHWISAVFDKYGKELKWNWIQKKVNTPLNHNSLLNLVKITGLCFEELPHQKIKYKYSSYQPPVPTQVNPTASRCSGLWGFSNMGELVLWVIFPSLVSRTGPKQPGKRKDRMKYVARV